MFYCLSAILFAVAQHGIRIYLLIIFNFTNLHSISSFCTQFHVFALCLVQIDMFSANQNVEIVACMLITKLISIEFMYIVIAYVACNAIAVHAGCLSHKP